MPSPSGCDNSLADRGSACRQNKLCHSVHPSCSSLEEKYFALFCTPLHIKQACSVTFANKAPDYLGGKAFTACVVSTPISGNAGRALYIDHQHFPIQTQDVLARLNKFGGDDGAAFIQKSWTQSEFLLSTYPSICTSRGIFF